MKQPTPLKSSFLEHCSYDEKEKCLTVGMRNGQEYTYKDVPETIYEGLMNSDSAGAFFSANIKSSFKLKEKE